MPLRFNPLHGMEEVVGSIPTRSTNQSNNLDRVNIHGLDVCVMVCHNPLFGACGKGLHSFALGFQTDVAVPLQHLPADVPRYPIKSSR